jgi:uncharacterized protein DUF2188
LTFLFSPEKESKFFKLVSANSGDQGPRQHRRSRAEGDRAQRSGDREQTRHILVTRENGGWLVEIEEDNHRKTYHTKADAVHHARELARSHQSAELTIETADGEEEQRVEYDR